MSKNGLNDVKNYWAIEEARKLREKKHQLFIKEEQKQKRQREAEEKQKVQEEAWSIFLTTYREKVGPCPDFTLAQTTDPFNSIYKLPLWLMTSIHTEMGEYLVDRKQITLGNRHLPESNELINEKQWMELKTQPDPWSNLIKLGDYQVIYDSTLGPHEIIINQSIFTQIQDHFLFLVTFVADGSLPIQEVKPWDYFMYEKLEEKEEPYTIRVGQNFYTNKITLWHVKLLPDYTNHLIYLRPLTTSKFSTETELRKKLQQTLEESNSLLLGNLVSVTNRQAKVSMVYMIEKITVNDQPTSILPRWYEGEYKFHVLDNPVPLKIEMWRNYFG